MEYYDGRLCVTMHELVGNGIMSEPNYKQMARRGRFEMARQGKGAGNYALIVLDSLPDKYRAKAEEVLGNGDEVLVAGWFRENYQLDQAAVKFFLDWASQYPSDQATAEKAREYAINASVINACIRLYDRASTAQRMMGKSYQWEKMAKAIESLREQFGHTLPSSPYRFRKKVAQFRKEGYGSLISGKYGNQSARLMTYKEERVILGIAGLENQPYNTTVREMYIMFLCGELEVYDIETGECFNPDEFAKKGQEPWIPSDATIANYLNRPKNKYLLEQRHRSRMAFYHVNTH